MASSFLPRWGIEWSHADMTDLAAVRAALRPATRLIWAETPTNPMMKVQDIVGLAEIARNAGAQLLVDSTFPTPALLRPLSLGADVTLHSTTKYLGGHSDVQGGALVFARRDVIVAVSDIVVILYTDHVACGLRVVLLGHRVSSTVADCVFASLVFVAMVTVALIGAPLAGMHIRPI